MLIILLIIGFCVLLCLGLTYYLYTKLKILFIEDAEQNTTCQCRISREIIHQIVLITQSLQELNDKLNGAVSEEQILNIKKMLSVYIKQLYLCTEKLYSLFYNGGGICNTN